MKPGMTMIATTSTEGLTLEIEDKGGWFDLRLKLRGVVMVSHSFFNDDAQRLQAILDGEAARLFVGDVEP